MRHTAGLTFPPNQIDFDWLSDSNNSGIVRCLIAESFTHGLSACAIVRATETWHLGHDFADKIMRLWPIQTNRTVIVNRI
jgi:hypothetical protein